MILSKALFLSFAERTRHPMKVTDVGASMLPGIPQVNSDHQALSIYLFTSVYVCVHVLMCVPISMRLLMHVHECMSGGQRSTLCLHQSLSALFFETTSHGT